MKSKSVGDIVLGNKPEKRRKPIPIETQKKLLIRSKGKCENCGKSLENLKPLFHHIDGNPRNNQLSNLKVLCPDCHYSPDFNKSSYSSA